MIDPVDFVEKILSLVFMLIVIFPAIFYIMLYIPQPLPWLTVSLSVFWLIVLGSYFFKKWNQGD